MADLLQECAKAFERLTNYQYHIVAGPTEGLEKQWSSMIN